LVAFFGSYVGWSKRLVRLTKAAEDAREDAPTGITLSYVAAIAMLLVIYLVLNAAFVYKASTGHAVVGGFALRDEAKRDMQGTNLGVRETLYRSGNDPEAVWTPVSLHVTRWLLLLTWLGVCGMASRLLAEPVAGQSSPPDSRRTNSGFSRRQRR
jgi:hypothetical protein